MALSNVPSGQVNTQVDSSKNKPAMHAEQFELRGPLHAVQFELHGLHVAEPASA